jgi:ABC-type microcin C transport system permease subunit YejB
VPGAGSHYIGEAFLAFVFCILLRHLSHGGSCCQCLCVHGLVVEAVSIGPEHTPPGGQDEKKV